MTTIRKKVWPEHFSAVSSGAKPFEVRLADEQVQVGDTLVLEEWSPEAGYTGRSIERKVCSVLPLRDLPYWPREQVEAVGLQVIGFEVAPALAREVQRLQGECIDLHSALDLSCEREARAYRAGQEAMRERCAVRVDRAANEACECDGTLCGPGDVATHDADCQAWDLDDLADAIRALEVE